ncbi:hypothetical protein R1sor_017632 [Riccia sorocarpa]|uniref:Uncharacterized protein n=1 Tax=Riccia sorocarpa TaxID=122646 RepID=A0ABD3IAZ9_9MARC
MEGRADPLNGRILRGFEAAKRKLLGSSNSSQQMVATQSLKGGQVDPGPVQRHEDAQWSRLDTVAEDMPTQLPDRSEKGKAPALDDEQFPPLLTAPGSQQDRGSPRGSSLPAELEDNEDGNTTPRSAPKIANAATIPVRRPSDRDRWRDNAVPQRPLPTRSQEEKGPATARSPKPNPRSAANSPGVPLSSNPYNKLIDLEEDLEEAVGEKETADKPEPGEAETSKGLDIELLDSPKTPRVQDSQSEEVELEDAEEGEILSTPKGKQLVREEPVRKGLDNFLNSVAQQVRSPVRWADVGDEDLPVTEARPAKGRPPEDKSHTPDRGNDPKKRVRDLRFPEYSKVESFSQLLLPKQLEADLSREKNSPLQLGEKLADPPDQGGGIREAQEGRKTPHTGDQRTSRLEAGMKPKGNSQPQDQRINFSTYAGPPS